MQISAAMRFGAGLSALPVGGTIAYRAQQDRLQQQALDSDDNEMLNRLAITGGLGLSIVGLFAGIDGGGSMLKIWPATAAQLTPFKHGAALALGVGGVLAATHAAFDLTKAIAAS